MSARTPADDGLSPPETKAGRLQRACLELLREHERDDALPTNGKFLFYELEQAGVVPKHYLDERGRKRPRQPLQDVSDATMRLRERGIIPWWWIEDASRSLDEWLFSPSVYVYATEAIARARIDLWDGEPPPLTLCESRAVWGVSRQLALKYLVPIAPTGGMCGGFLVNEIAPLLKGNKRRVLYVGDFELRGPGEQIEDNTRRVLERHAKREFNADTWERIALTSAQVKASPRLRKLEVTKLDHRYKPPRPYRAVECEAMKQKPLLDIIRKHFDRLLPEPLADVLVREEAQRAKIGAALAKIARSAS